MYSALPSSNVAEGGEFLVGPSGNSNQSGPGDSTAEWNAWKEGGAESEPGGASVGGDDYVSSGEGMEPRSEPDGRPVPETGPSADDTIQVRPLLAHPPEDVWARI